MNAKKRLEWSVSATQQQAVATRTRSSRVVTRSRMSCLRTLFVLLATVSISVIPGFVERAKADNSNLSMMSKNKRIVFNNGTPVGGFVELDIFPDGSWQFFGHAHDSGFPSYNLSAVGFVHTTSGWVLEIDASGHMAGTVESGSRSIDWSQSGMSSMLPEVWNDIDVVDVGYNVGLDASTIFWQSVGLVGTVLGVVSLAE